MDHADRSPNGISLNDLGQSFLVNFTAGSFVKLIFLKTFRGNQLHSYSQLFKMSMMYNNVDSLKATWNVTLKGKNQQAATFKIVPLPSLSNKEYHARLHEHYAVNNLTAYELQNILIDIESVHILGSFAGNGSVIVNIELVSATKGFGEDVGYVENCTCPSNYTELSCGFCNSGK